MKKLRDDLAVPKSMYLILKMLEEVSLVKRHILDIVAPKDEEYVIAMVESIDMQKFIWLAKGMWDDKLKESTVFKLFSLTLNIRNVSYFVLIKILSLYFATLVPPYTLKTPIFRNIGIRVSIGYETKLDESI